jgi:anthranilate synthase component II
METTKILVIDNYDSFTYNLVHAIKKISGLEVDVFRNDEIKLEDIDNTIRLCFHPGPVCQRKQVFFWTL